MATTNVSQPTETTLYNVAIDKVEVSPAEGTKKARANGRIVQYNSAGYIQWSKFFTTWDCIEGVVAASQPNSVDPVTKMVDKVTSEEGDLGSASDADGNRERIKYDRTYIVTGAFTRKSKNDKWYENFTLTGIRVSE
jgi:hypothetical protein